MTSPLYWSLLPIICLASFVLCLVWYNTLLESSEGTIDTKTSAAHSRKELLTGLSKVLVRVGGIGFFGAVLLGVFSALKGVFGYSAFAFLMGFFLVIVATYGTSVILLQATPRIATDFQTSSQEGQRFLKQSTTLLLLVVASLGSFFVSATLWFLHLFYDSNVLNVSMRTVQYLGHSFWNDAIASLPSFQAIVTAEAAQTMVFLWVGVVIAWVSLRIFNTDKSQQPFYDLVAVILVLMTGLGVVSLSLGTALLERFIDYPKTCAILPIILLGVSVVGLCFTRLFQAQVRTVMPLCVSGVVAALLFGGDLPVIGGLSIVGGFVLAFFGAPLFKRFGMFPALGLMVAIFFISHGTLSAGKAWFHFSLGALGFFLGILPIFYTLFSSSLLHFCKRFNSETPCVSADSSAIFIQAASVFLLALWLGGFLEMFKQALVFYAHTSVFHYSEMAFSTLYAAIGSGSIYNIHALDFSNFCTLFQLTLVNPAVVLSAGCSGVVYHTNRLKHNYLYSMIVWVLPLLCFLGFGLSGVLGFGVGSLVHMTIPLGSDENVFLRSLTASLGIAAGILCLWVGLFCAQHFPTY